MAQFLDYTGLGHFKDKNDALYAKQDGSYEGMTVGNAEQLISTVGVSDSAPYTFRTTGGSADVGDRMNLKAVVGGTVVWNQMLYVPNGSKTDRGVTATQNASIGLIALSGTSSAAYSLCFAPVATVKDHVYLSTIQTVANPNGVSLGEPFISTIGWGTGKRICKASHDRAIATVGLVVPTNTDTTGITLYANIFDLTQMFGSTIADYVYTLERGTAGAGVAWLKSYGFFEKPYYPYKEAALESVKTSAHKTYGFNAYNPSTGKAKVVGGKVYQITGSYTALSLDGTSITPDANGYFTPSANGELTVTGGNGTTTCVHLKWDGERDGDYEPYEEHTYALDDVELRGIPKLDANNNLYYDGDSYEPDGTVTRKYGIRAYTSGDATDGSTMITDGTNTVYKLITPTTESADAYTELQICDDFGTEEFVDAATRDFDMPCGSLAVYRPNLRAKLEMSPNSPSDGDGLYVVQQISGENTYVPLVVPTELPSVSDTDEGKVLTVNNSGVWVAQNPKFVVTLTPTALDYSGTMDKTVAEIDAAYKAGRKIVFRTIMSGTSFVETPLNFALDDGGANPSFGTQVIDLNNNVLVVAWTGQTDDDDTYNATIYTLTPAT